MKEQWRLRGRKGNDGGVFLVIIRYKVKVERKERNTRCESE